METSRLQVSLTTMLVLVACVAVNLWLFRLGMLWGIVGLNITKHVVIAQLCQAVGLNRKIEDAPVRPNPKPPRVTQAEPSAN
ncbi:MAG: hypothetical protein JWN86_3667 [Planctomycetota bacterium]|nr:hypothetical protein [Planctomycetota bacterium]